MNKLADPRVYHKALSYTKLVRKTTKGFPREELFALTAQFKRAADSIVLNIAEGAGDYSSREFLRFLDYSVRSGFECIGCADIALENCFVNEGSHRELVSHVNEIIAMLDGLRKSIVDRSAIRKISRS